MSDGSFMVAAIGSTQSITVELTRQNQLGQRGVCAPFVGEQSGAGVTDGGICETKGE